MTYTVSITSQGQISIPAKLRKRLNLNKNKKALVSEENGQIIGFCEGGSPREPSPYGKGEIYTLYILHSKRFNFHLFLSGY